MSRQDISPDLMSLVKSYLKRRGQICWIEWLPLSEIAIDDPEKWITAFNALGSTDIRGDMLELLQKPDSGPLADALLILLAKHALQIEDEQIREFVVEDVSQAVQRTADRIMALKIACEPLAEQVAWIGERLRSGFDIAQELTRLEAHLAELRAEEHRKAEEYDQIHALEREIIRLETYRKTFAGYDLTERSTFRDELQTETDRLREQKEVLQRTIADLLALRDEERNNVKLLQQQHDANQAKLEANREKNRELTEGIVRLQSELENTRIENSRAQQEHDELLLLFEKEERLGREAQVLISESRGKLEELQAQAKESSRDDIVNRVREVFALLPPDEADRACR